MAKSAHREAQRVILPNGMWVLLYEDGEIKISGYDRSLVVTEVMNRPGEAQVYLRIAETTETPRSPQRRATDLVTAPRPAWEAVQGAAR